MGRINVFVLDMNKLGRAGAQEIFNNDIVVTSVAVYASRQIQGLISCQQRALGRGGGVTLSLFCVPMALLNFMLYIVSLSYDYF